MRFPLRLRAKLFKSRILGLFGGDAARQSIFVFSPCVTHLSPSTRFDELSAELEWHSPEECASRVRDIDSPIVWLSGTEPLLHQEIGALTNSIVESDRYVFLHTSGYGLRQRIHEFRPDSRLFLTLDFSGREEVHNRTIGRADAFQQSLEAIRAAKLSGFLVAAHLTVTAETNLCDIGELIEFLDAKDVDGFIVSSGGNTASTGKNGQSETLEDARAMIRCNPWENFSRLLDKAYEQVSPSPHSAKLPAAGENVFEEGD